MPDSSMPLVTVAMPVRNAMPYLPAALDSILHQTYRRLDVLVIDDGSTDDSAAFLAQVRDERLRVRTTGGRGLVAALNLALDDARGELFARQDGDDISMPDRIEKQVRFLGEHHDVGVVACRAEYIDADSRPVFSAQTNERRRLQHEATRPGRLHALLPLTCCLVHGSIVARRRTLEEAGGYREARRAAEDYDLWLRLLPRHRFAMIDEALYFHRLHAGQVSGRYRDEQLESTLRAKLDHLRAVAPNLPSPARTVIVGAGEGASRYAELCRDYALTPVNDGDASADLILVADLTDPGGRVQDVEPPAGWRACGNFLIREAWC